MPRVSEFGYKLDQINRLEVAGRTFKINPGSLRVCEERANLVVEFVMYDTSTSYRMRLANDFIGVGVNPRLF